MKNSRYKRSKILKIYNKKIQDMKNLRYKKYEKFKT